MSRTIEVGRIRDNLAAIEAGFADAMASTELEKGTILSAMFSKLAVLELCGWLEQTIDRILYHYVNVTISNRQLRNTIKEQVIDTVYGFKYAKELKPLFMKILGAARFNHILRVLGRKGQDEILLSCIQKLNRERNVAAHTYWNDKAQQHFDAPSCTYQEFLTLVPIVTEIDKCIKQFARHH